MASLQLIFATAMVPPPPVLLPGLNNVYGRAQYKKDSGVVRYLGQFNKTSECVSACLAYNGNGAQRCMSFTHHLPNMPTNWHGLCFGVVDHSWKPVPDRSSPPIITSGRVPWPEEGCGVGAPAGCTWQLDPWCLRSKYAERNLTTRAAAAACAADSKCLGFSFSASGPMANASSSSTPVPHSFFDTTDGGPGACWARRRHFALDNDPYRAGFHYQPKDGHWMNDPNGPMYYGGLYHLFYQWNPVSSDAYNMHWGHAVSPDLVRWTELPFALAPDEGACGGEWSGSATPNAVIGPPARGRSTSVVTPVLSYSVQCNNYFGQATPANLSDPLLLQWNKTFPTATKPHFVPGGFRDPSEAWRGTDGVWRQLAACTGGACLFNSSDFLKWQPDGYAVYPYGPPPHEHVAPGPGPLPARSRVRVANDEGEGREPLEWAKLALDAGNPPTWECPDLFVLPAKSRRGATAFGATASGATAFGATAFGATGSGSKGSAVKPDAAQPASMPAGDAPEQLWVLKASGGLTAATRSIGVDFWATGSFVERNGSFVAGPNSDALPSDGQRCDFGQYYASKSFFDPVAGERVIFGWLINFAGGAEEPPPLIEWNGVQATPRAIREDPLLARRLTFYPIDALRTLRILPPAAYQHAVTLRPQTTSPLSPAVAGSRLDIVLTFSPLPVAVELGTTFGVSVLGGAANATITAVHESTCGQVIRHSATPTLRCANLTVGPHHGPFAFSADQPLELRVLVDGSVVEAFVAGGRAAVTHRVYPSSDAPLSVAVLNRGTRAIALSTLEVYSMHAVHGLTIDALRRHRQA